MSHAILIIDDDPQVLTMLTHYLGETLGYDVDAAASGHEAIEAALKKKYNLAIVDVHMPDQSGTDTYTRLKKMQPELEAIFFTGDVEFEQRMDFLRFALPAERVIKKPLKQMNDLTKLIISILGPPGVAR